MKQVVSLSWGSRPRRHAAVPSGLSCALLLVLASSAAGQENLRLDCGPRKFNVVPGEPMRLQLSVESGSAVPLRWHIPDDPLLKLRAVEKLPVRRTREGVVVYQRVIVWQGLEPGTVLIKTLSVETRERKLLFPEVTITVRDPTP